MLIHLWSDLAIFLGNQGLRNPWGSYVLTPSPFSSLIVSLCECLNRPAEKLREKEEMHTGITSRSKYMCRCCSI